MSTSSSKVFGVGGVERASTADLENLRRPAEARTAGEAGNPVKNARD